MRFVLVTAMVALIALAYWGMYRGWQSRVQRQSTLPVPSSPARDETKAGPWSGTYLGATRIGRWLDRIDVHGLGNRSLATVRVTGSAIDIRREQERSFSIPRADLVGVRADKGIAGRAFEDAGIVVVSFRLGDETIDIGLRFPDTADHLSALAALSQEVQ